MIPIIGILIILGMLIVGFTFLIGLARFAQGTLGSRPISTALGVGTACLVIAVISLMLSAETRQQEITAEPPWPNTGTGTMPPSGPIQDYSTSRSESSIPVEEEIARRETAYQADSGPPPTWMNDKPELVGGVYRVPIHSGQYTEHELCNEALLAKARAELQNYLRQHFGEQVDPRIVPDSFLAKLIQQRYVEDDRGQHEHHALLVFDRGIQQQLEQFRRDAVIGDRLLVAGGSTAGVLGLLSVIWLGLVLLPERKPGEAVATDAPVETAP